MAGINKRILKSRFIENVQDDNTSRHYLPFHCVAEYMIFE
jgi:hypothetical protein